MKTFFFLTLRQDFGLALKHKMRSGVEKMRNMNFAFDTERGNMIMSHSVFD